MRGERVGSRESRHGIGKWQEQMLAVQQGFKHAPSHAPVPDEEEAAAAVAATPASEPANPPGHAHVHVPVHGHPNSPK